MIEGKTLREEGIKRYSSYYCGLCRVLGEHFGSTGQKTLTYDMTFLGVLLSGIYNLTQTKGQERCVMHPLRSHDYIVTSATDYIADMNLFLAYYQYMDDWKDDRNKGAYQKSKKIEPALEGIRKRWERQTTAIEEGLLKLSEMEQANELNPDFPTKCFGHILGEVFAWKEDDYQEVLYQMGEGLGRYVYLLDAINDLKDDLKNQQYNPLVAQINMDYKMVLTSIMAEVTDVFEGITWYQDRDIIENVLYAGVWQGYRIDRTKEKQKR